MGKYDDMIGLTRPISGKPRMPVADRAKIFQPFAALKGHDELIKEQQKLLVEHKELSKERLEELNGILESIQTKLSKGERPEVCVVHFVKDEKTSKRDNKCVGKYVETIGMVRKIDVLEERLWMGELGVSIQDIFEIKGMTN